MHRRNWCNNDRFEFIVCPSHPLLFSFFFLPLLGCLGTVMHNARYSCARVSATSSATCLDFCSGAKVTDRELQLSVAIVVEGSSNWWKDERIARQLVEVLLISFHDTVMDLEYPSSNIDRLRRIKLWHCSENYSEIMNNSSLLLFKFSFQWFDNSLIKRFVKYICNVMYNYWFLNSSTNF